MKLLHSTSDARRDVVAMVRLTGRNKSPNFARMQHLQSIDAIERRAEAINLTLPAVCQRAGVPVSTIWRWRHGKTSPNTATVEAHVGSLERTIERAEEEIKRRVG